MRDTKIIFEALPHVDTIWITTDGNFHLHSANGGEEVHRGEVVAENKPEAPKKAKELIEAIEQATTPEEVLEILREDDRATVKAAADKKLASF